MPLIEAIKILKNISKEQVSEKKFWEAVGTLIEYAENESIPKEKVEKKIEKISNETWYLSGGEEAKRACMDELEDLIY